MNVSAPVPWQRWMAALATLGMLTMMTAGVAADAMAKDLAPVPVSHADPLSSLPLKLDLGPILPGDEARISCPATFTLPEVLSLGDAVDLALCNNPQLQAAWATIRLRAAGLGQARSAYLPSFTLTAGRQISRQTRSGTQADINSSIAGTSYSASLGWRLFDFGGREAGTRSAQAMLDAAMASHDASMQKVLAGVVQSYFDAQTAEAAWHARQRQETMASTMLETVARREQRGAAAQTDRLQAATELARASLERNRADGAYRKSLAQLAAALGIAAADRLKLANDLADPEDTLRNELDNWLERAQAQHPGLSSARAQLDAARQNIIATRSEGLPTLELSGALYRNGRPNQGPVQDSRESVIGVMLRIPLFDGFAHTYKVRGAQAQADQKEAELREVERQVMLDVAQAYADASAALGNLTTSQALLTAAEQARDSVQRKYDRSAASIQDLLSTQRAHDEAQQERLRCLADWRSARLRLLAAAGGLGRWALRPAQH